jgi:hypothetical protein
MARRLQDLAPRDLENEERERTRREMQRAREEELEFSNGIEAHPPGRRGGPCPLCVQKDERIAELERALKNQTCKESR